MVWYALQQRLKKKKEKLEVGEDRPDTLSPTGDGIFHPVRVGSSPIGHLFPWQLHLGVLSGWPGHGQRRTCNPTATVIDLISSFACRSPETPDLHAFLRPAPILTWSRKNATSAARPERDSTAYAHQKNSYPRATCRSPSSSVYYSDLSPFFYYFLLFILTHSLIAHLVCIRPSVLHFFGPFGAPLSWLSKVPPTNPAYILHSRSYGRAGEHRC